MSREGGDILQHDRGIPYASREGMRGERVSVLEECGPCYPTIPKDTVDGRQGRYQRVVVIIVYADQSVRDGRRAAAGAASTAA